MQTITLGLQQIVRVPASWTRFLFQGCVYGRDETGRWIVVGAWAKVW